MHKVCSINICRFEQACVMSYTLAYTCSIPCAYTTCYCCCVGCCEGVFEEDVCIKIGVLPSVFYHHVNRLLISNLLVCSLLGIFCVENFDLLLAGEKTITASAASCTRIVHGLTKNERPFIEAP